MPIAILIAAVAAYVYALVAFPRYRRTGIVSGVIVLVLAGIYFWLNPAESNRRTERVTPDELVIDNIELSRTTRGATVTGRVLNPSAQDRVREIVLAMQLLDCADEGTAVSDCLVIGEAEAIARPDVPPGQTRGFTAHFLFSNLPALTGILKWDITPTEVRSTQVSR